MYIFFREAYPEYEVENIQLAYDVNKANELDRNRLIIIYQRFILRINFSINYQYLLFL